MICYFWLNVKIRSTISLLYYWFLISLSLFYSKLGLNTNIISIRSRCNNGIKITICIYKTCKPIIILYRREILPFLYFLFRIISWFILIYLTSFIYPNYLSILSFLFRCSKITINLINNSIEPSILWDFLKNIFAFFRCTYTSISYSVNQYICQWYIFFIKTNSYLRLSINNRRIGYYYSSISFYLSS